MGKSSTSTSRQVKVCGIILVMNTTEKSTRSTRQRRKPTKRQEMMTKRKIRKTRRRRRRRTKLEETAWAAVTSWV
ncbi:unnamed protein product [Cladocopium goreaui]|uniref:Uncharacterized protein n=1 Tax=Cladocopium goreaui TaxID=2562237 RepID=A0A9P1GI12_9DINO|nr:unnamed protein product [Cladocopium goreaui]